MHRRLAFLICAFAFAPTIAHADANHDCNQKETTADITECLAEKTATLDGIIDALVDEEASGAEPNVAGAVNAAQTAWLAYREAACLVYRLGEGTIAAIEAGECRVRLSGQRLGELRHAHQ